MKKTMILPEYRGLFMGVEQELTLYSLHVVDV